LLDGRLKIDPAGRGGRADILFTPSPPGFFQQHTGALLLLLFAAGSVPGALAAARTGHIPGVLRSKTPKLNALCALSRKRSLRARGIERKYRRPPEGACGIGATARFPPGESKAPRYGA
jgi:hypothetical protein